MNAKIPFKFRILRYIHDSFTGEFLNIGLALYSQAIPYLQIRLLQKYGRITNTFPGVEGYDFHRYISSLQNKFDNLADKINSKQLTIEQLSLEGIDNLLATVLPPDDSAVQFGPIQGGMAGDLGAVFSDLYFRLVEEYLPTDEHLSRTENEIWNLFNKPLRLHNVTGLLHPTIIHTSNDDIELEHAWKNGKWKALQPISFDLKQTGTIQNKARLWLGINVILEESSEVACIYYLLGKPRRDNLALQKAYFKAKDLLGTGNHSKKIEIIEEDNAEEFAKEISPLIRSDTENKE